MALHDGKGRPEAAPASAKDARAERLAAALRENLKRRKAQARGRDGRGGAGQDAPEANAPEAEAPEADGKPAGDTNT